MGLLFSFDSPMTTVVPLPLEEMNCMLESRMNTLPSLGKLSTLFQLLQLPRSRGDTSLTVQLSQVEGGKWQEPLASTHTLVASECIQPVHARFSAHRPPQPVQVCSAERSTSSWLLQFTSSHDRFDRISERLRRKEMLSFYNIEAFS